MLQPLYDINTLTDYIEADALIITANNRLASKIRQAWGIHQANKGLKTWCLPDIHAVESWLIESWQQCCDAGIKPCSHRLLVSAQQEKILWELAIDTDTNRPPLVLPAAYASSAQRGYRIIQQWRIPEKTLTEESPHFSRWISNFRELMNERQLITLSDCAAQLKEIITSGKLNQHKQIVMVGFQTVPPLYQELLTVACQTLKKPAAKQQQNLNSVTKLPLTNEIEELQKAAIWAANKLSQEPGHRIGIVVPELARLRPQVERIFLKALLPDDQQLSFAPAIPPFNISAGIPLSETPIAATAMALLNLNRNEQSITDCCVLLNSPFWGENHLPLRATAENQLRNLARFKIRTSQFRYQIFRAEGQFPENSFSVSLAAGLEQLETLRRQAAAKNSFTYWGQLFSEQLSASGWPGTRPLSSVEYQQHKHWHQLLEQFSTLDQLHIQIDLYEALRQLQQLAQQIVFQPETPDSPVQILGLLESAELHFDHLWIMAMNDRQWPQACQLHPLLSAATQREYLTPRSSPEKELQLAQLQIDSYLRNANEIVFSYSLKDGDSQLSCTPLIEQIAVTQREQFLAKLNSPESEHKPLPLEEVDCSQGPALQIDDQPIKGGSAIFDTQAACPFNAFAKYRLGANSPPEPSLGLSAMDRGSLLHLCLENIWHQLGSQQKLLSLTDQQLDDLLASAITNSLSPWQKSHPELLGERFTQLEIQRLQHLLRRWLELEKQRPPFTVEAIEGRHNILFADIPLSLRIDRVDLLENGKQFIIDYKTGNPNVNSWMGERPEQPQLPLYALTSEQDVAGIAFAAINTDQQRFIGIAEQDHLAPGLTAINTDENQNGWLELQTQWRKELEQLAEEFKHGDAEVCFYNNTAALWQSELLPLNRWPEYTALETEL